MAIRGLAGFGAMALVVPASYHPDVAVPWNNWYHCISTTYGNWLPGDPRGFRTRHHREHVEGDYNNPPAPGRYAAREARSRTLLARSPVRLGDDEIPIVLDSLMCHLQRSDGVEPLIACLDDHHLHLLCRFPDGEPRRHLGAAHKHSSHVLRQRQPSRPRGGIRAKRPK